MLVNLAAAVAASLALAGEPVSEGARLDVFFRGIENGCQMTEAYRGFASSLAVKDPISNEWLVGRPVLPRALTEAFGTPAVERKTVAQANYLHVSIPVRGTFRRLPVAEFDYARGIDNGIAIYWLRISAPIEAVRAVLGEDVARGNALLAAKAPHGGVNELVSDGKDTLIVCDLSS